MRPARVTRRWCLSAFVLVAAVAGCSDDDDDAAPTTAAPTTTTVADSSAEPVEPGFVFGFLAPGAGLLDEIAVAQERALVLAVDDINAAGGVLGSPAASLTVDEPPGGTVQTAVDELVTGGAGVILGPVGSDSALAARPTLTERQLLACSASATLPGLTDDNTGNSFFRTALADDLLVSYAADELETYRDQLDPPPAAPLRVTVMARGDDYGTTVGNGLASELAARGFDATVQGYHPRTVIFTSEVAEVVPTNPDLIVIVAYEEAPSLLRTLIEAGFPAARIAGLDGLFVPRLASQTFPSAPERLDGITILGTSGDRAFTERLIQQPGQQQIVYGAQLYDCAIVVALAATAAGSTDPVAYGAQMRAVTAGGRTCASYADCKTLLDAGEDVDYDGPTGRIALDELGDVTAVRFTIASFESGQMLERRSTDVDFTERRRAEAFAASVFTTRIQQGLRALGYYHGEITGIFDEATAEAIRALQRDLGLPETGEYDEATDAALRERLGDKASILSDATAGIQQLLADLGHYDGPIDGRFSTATADAIRALQRDLGVPETGMIDVATLRAIHAAGAAGAPSEPPPTEPPADTQPPPTAPPPTAQPPTAPPPTAPPPTEPPPTAPPPTEPPPTEPPPTEPPATQPPETQPPDTQPPDTTTTQPPEPPATDPPPDEAGENLFEVLAGDPRFSTVVELLRAAGYDEDLDELGPLTVFAPVNDAFNALPPGALDDLKADPDRIEATLAYYIVLDGVLTDELRPGSLSTANGSILAVEAAPGGITVGGARIVAPDIAASNGIIHGIDQVLNPG